MQLVLDDLMHQRAMLCETLETAAKATPRTDFVDCWNLLDEIRECDRRIETLRAVMTARTATCPLKN